MRPKSLLLLVLALGCGLVASIGITQVMAKRDDGGNGDAGETQAILVALDEIPQWTPLSAQHLKLEPWPADKIPEGALTNIEDVEGRRTRTKIYAGDTILETKLFGVGANEHGATMMIPKGYRVVTVKVDAVSGGSGLILPGDRVDVAVVLRADRSKGIPEATTKTFLQDVKVFAVNDQFQVDSSTDDKTITAKTVALLVTPEQAQMVMVAAESGKIQLVMRSPDEEAQDNISSISLSQILDTDSGSDRDKETLVETPAAPPQPQESLLAQRFKDFLSRSRASEPDPKSQEEPAETVETWQMRVIRGGQPEQVVLEKRGETWETSTGALHESGSWPTTPDGLEGIPAAEPDGLTAEPDAAEAGEDGPSEDLGPEFEGATSDKD